MTSPVLKAKVGLSPPRSSPRNRRDYYNYVDEDMDTITDDESDGDIARELEDVDTTQNSSYGSPKQSLSPNFRKRFSRSPTNSPYSSFTESRARRNNSQKIGEQENMVKISKSIKPCKHLQLYIIIAIALLLTFAGLLTSTKGLFLNAENVKEDLPQDRLAMLSEFIARLKLKFHNQAVDIWNDIFAGMYDVMLNAKKPGIIILFGDRIETVKCLAHLLGNISSSTFGTYSYLTLKPQDFQNDVGEVIHELKEKISQKKAVVVENLLEINPEALKAFHNFCDRENPLVHEAIYIIIMNVGKHNRSRSNLHIVESEITKNFIDRIEKDMLDPIVTRITDGVVISINPEFDIDGC